MNYLHIPKNLSFIECKELLKVLRKQQRITLGLYKNCKTDEEKSIEKEIYEHTYTGIEIISRKMRYRIRQVRGYIRTPEQLKMIKDRCHNARITCKN